MSLKPIGSVLQKKRPKIEKNSILNLLPGHSGEVPAVIRLRVEEDVLSERHPEPREHHRLTDLPRIVDPLADVLHDADALASEIPQLGSNSINENFS